MYPSPLLILPLLLPLTTAIPPLKPPFPSFTTKLVKFFSASPPLRTCPPPGRPQSTAPFDAAGLHRFEWIVDRTIARSSAPFYRCRDGDQHMTPRTTAFLKRQGIKHVISLNEEARNPSIGETLQKAKIHYTPIPLSDYQSPSFADFNAAFEAFRLQGSARTLVWCGYGHGRSGTFIVALLMYLEHHKPTPRVFRHLDYAKYHVETEAQAHVLDMLQAELKRRRLEPSKTDKTKKWYKTARAPWARAVV
ncbi:hypothetical protein XA68_13494 [Ophiocordyceps unilateralis]|uniref:Tyrosine specific protein phosphatases domain-containing protein n=1 Tax=Ophiocordyceps unilateralis TaxID=268505 RepID=A0A2A9PB94_OPHUN|nr:hypothetical protein XA68_13494 [Ophiocordyceps unilateralis]